MASFEPAVAMVLRHEGGYVWDKDDPGGPTNYGITQSVYSTWLKRAATPDEVHGMTVETAKEIYRNLYWSAVNGANITSQEVANHVLDLSVLRGVGNGVRALQQAAGLTPDGVAGTKTIAAVNAIAPGVLLNSFRSLCVAAFAAIVTKRPASLKFLCNWCKRAEEITETVNGLWQKTSAQGFARAPGPAPLKT